MQNPIEPVLDEMEASLHLQGKTLFNADGMRLSLCETRLYAQHNSAALFFVLTYSRRGKKIARKESGSVGKQKPLGHIMKLLAAAWVKASSDSPSSVIEQLHLLKAIDRAPVLAFDSLGRWPNLEKFALRSWEEAQLDLGRQRLEKAMAQARSDLTTAMRAGLQLEDIQNIWREILVQKVQES